MEIENGKFYLMTQHRHSTWIVLVKEVGRTTAIVDAISVGKKCLNIDWAVELEGRKFVQADDDQVRHLVTCIALSHYRSKPGINGSQLNSYPIC